MEELPAGDVELIEEIGSGGFSRVHRGRSTKLGMEVAVKVLDRQSCEAFSSLMKETDMMSKANSTYVLRILAQYKYEYKGHIEYGLVMEYMPRGSLHSLFNTLKEKRVLIPWPLRFRILHQVAIAMNFLHGLNPAIIHRDLKPQNVLLRKDFDVQLTDFGLARNETSVSIGLVGTLSYMPPESKIQTPTKKFDVYSFSILIWWILSGQDPQYPIALDTDLIMNCKQRGIRPNVKHLDYCMTEKMVPEVIELMKQCWDGDPDSRPCFTECMERLEKMKKAYDGEIEDAVLEVLKELQKASPSPNNQAADTPDGANNVQSSDSELDPPQRILFGKQFKQKSSEEEDNKTAASNIPSEDIFIADAKEFLRRNFSKIIKEKPAWKSILDDLFTQEIFKEEQVDSILKDHRTVQDQIRETLLVIIKQGKNSCMTLLQIMNRHHPSLMSKMEI